MSGNGVHFRQWHSTVTDEDSDDDDEHHSTSLDVGSSGDSIVDQIHELRKKKSMGGSNNTFQSNDSIVDEREEEEGEAYAEEVLSRHHNMKFTDALTACHDWLWGASDSVYVSASKEVNDFLRGAAIGHVEEDEQKMTLLQPRARDRNKGKMKRARARWMAVPDDKVYICWTLLSMVVIILVSYVVPVRLAFGETAPNSTFCQGQDGWWVLDAFIDVMFLADLLLVFWTVIPVAGGDYVIKPKAIAMYHLASVWFWVDAAASIPTALIDGPQYSNSGSSDNNSDMATARASKLLRLNRLVKLFRIFRLVRFLREIEKLAIVNPGALRLGRLLFYFISVLHVIACLYWSVGLVSKFCDDEMEPFAECGQGWSLSWNSIQAMGLHEQYGRAFYFALSATTGVGYDLEPTNYTEFVFTSACIILGVFVNALLIGSVPGALEYLDRHLTRRKLAMDKMNDYMRVTQVPRHIQKSVRSYFDFLQEEDLDFALDSQALLSTLPDSISTRIRVATSIKAIEGVALFDTFLSPTCKIMLSQKIRTQVGVPGEYLYVQGDHGGEMFIIKTGRVQLTRVHVASSAKFHLQQAFSKLRKLKAINRDLFRKVAKHQASLGDMISPPKSTGNGGTGPQSAGADGAKEAPPGEPSDGSADAPMKVKKPHRRGSFSFGLKRTESSASSSSSSSSVDGLSKSNIELPASSSQAPEGRGPTEQKPKPKRREAPPLVLGLGAGDFFGEGAVLGREHTTSALSVEYCILQVLSRADVDEVCKHFPELTKALHEVAELRERQFFVKPKVGLKADDIVKVVKDGSSKYGAKARVVDPDCDGVVKVVLIGDTAFKTYKKADLEVDASSTEPIKEGNLVRIIKSGSEFGKIGKVTHPNWIGMIKVTLVAGDDTSFKLYKRSDVELFTKDDAGATAVAALRKSPIVKAIITGGLPVQGIDALERLPNAFTPSLDFSEAASPAAKSPTNESIGEISCSENSVRVESSSASPGVHSESKTVSFQLGDQPPTLPSISDGGLVVKAPRTVHTSAAVPEDSPAGYNSNQLSPHANKFVEPASTHPENDVPSDESGGELGTDSCAGCSDGQRDSHTEGGDESDDDGVQHAQNPFENMFFDL